MSKEIKLSLYSGAVYAAIQALLRWLDSGFTEKLFRGIIKDFVLVSFVAFLFILIHKLWIRFTTKENSEEAFNVHQQRNVILHVPSEKAFEICKASLGLIGRHQIVIEDRSLGKIETITARPFRPYVDVICYEINKVGEQLTKIEISSCPFWSNVSADYGRNLKNIEKINDFLLENDNHLDINLISSKLKAASETLLEQASAAKAVSEASEKASHNSFNPIPR